LVRHFENASLPGPAIADVDEDGEDVVDAAVEEDPAAEFFAVVDVSPDPPLEEHATVPPSRAATTAPSSATRRPRSITLPPEK
jgi:hypothetical protein